jgi:NADH-quinone oxidoreductase subunit J
MTLLLICLTLLVFSLAITPITINNAVYAVLYFIAVFLLVTGILLSLGVEFLAFVYAIVYIGAVAVLFLFVVMLLHVSSKHMRMIKTPWIMLLALSVTWITYKIFKHIGEVINLPIYISNVAMLLSNINIPVNIESCNTLNYWSPSDELYLISNKLYNVFGMLFIETGFVLLLALTAVIILTKTLINSKCIPSFSHVLSVSYSFVKSRRLASTIHKSEELQKKQFWQGKYHILLYCISMLLIFCTLSCIIFYFFQGKIAIKLDNNFHEYYRSFVWSLLVFVIIFYYSMRGHETKSLNLRLGACGAFLVSWFTAQYPIIKIIKALFGYNIKYSSEGFLQNDIAQGPGIIIAKIIDNDILKTYVAEFLQKNAYVSQEQINNFPLLKQGYDEGVNFFTNLYSNSPFDYNNINLQLTEFAGKLKELAIHEQAVKEAAEKLAENLANTIDISWLYDWCTWQNAGYVIAGVVVAAGIYFLVRQSAMSVTMDDVQNRIQQNNVDLLGPLQRQCERQNTILAELIMNNLDERLGVITTRVDALIARVNNLQTGIGALSGITATQEEILRRITADIDSTETALRRLQDAVRVFTIG